MSDDDEIEAMKKIRAALEPLDDSARQRALQWAASRYRTSASSATTTRIPDVVADAPMGNSQFATFAELFDAAQPTTEKEKALVCAYWIQICQNVGSFCSADAKH